MLFLFLFFSLSTFPLHLSIHSSFIHHLLSIGSKARQDINAMDWSRRLLSQSHAPESQGRLNRNSRCWPTQAILPGLIQKVETITAINCSGYTLPVLCS
ncbi:hypothetical protein GGI43DRAFT_194317 [Trichoderma evansii]